jgi:hypothetical protein
VNLKRILAAGAWTMVCCAPLAASADTPPARASDQSVEAIPLDEQRLPALRPAGRPHVLFVATYAPGGSADAALTQGFHTRPGIGGRIAATLPVLGQQVMLEAEGVTDEELHRTGQMPVAGGPSYFQRAFVTKRDTEEVHAGVRLGDWPVFVSLAGFYRSGVYTDEVGTGLGIEALPRFDRAETLFGRAFFYPNVNNEDPFTNKYGKSLQLRWTRLSYEFGAAQRIGRGEFYAIESLGGEWMRAIVAPSSETFTHLTFGTATRL